MIHSPTSLLSAAKLTSLPSRAARNCSKRYCKWADDQRLSKLERLNGKEFGSRMALRCTRRHTNTGKVYDGVRVVKSTLW